MTCRQSSATSYSMTVHVFQSRAFERSSCLRAEKNCCLRSTLRGGSKFTTSVCGLPSGAPRLYKSPIARCMRLYAELSHQQQLATDANEASSSTSESEIDVETLVSAAKTAAEAGAHVSSIAFLDLQQAQRTRNRNVGGSSQISWQAAKKGHSKAKGYFA